CKFILRLLTGIMTIPLKNIFACFALDSHCDTGYLLFGDFCYHFESETVKNWEDAETYCGNQNGHLASIHSEEEISFLSVPTGISMWMGGHDSITEGGWEWTDGSPFRYVHWADGNPDDYYGEDCLSILVNSGKWNDDNCDYERGYICKRRGNQGLPSDLQCCGKVSCWQCGIRLTGTSTSELCLSVFAGNTPSSPPPHEGTMVLPLQIVCLH
uniref:C-type lectin domain-containing protein n=1 Tax=Scleropages formosus TaxID=113540 RepID=A0A8C9TZN5_SCLFO